jgi:hypothetical protein
MIFKLRRIRLVAILTGVIGMYGISPSFAQSDYLAESERKAREILQNVIQALGGEAYLKLTDMTRSGKAYQLKDENVKGLTHITILDKFPDMTRTEYENQNIVYINVGEKGSKIEYKNVKDQTGAELEDFLAARKHNLDYVLRVRLKEEGMRFRYLGKSRMDLDEAEVVQLIDRGGDKMKIFVSATTWLPLKMEYQTPGRGNRWTSDDERFYYSYHAISGIQVPFGIVRNANGYKVSELRFEEVQVDTGLSDAIFQPVHRKK